MYPDQDDPSGYSREWVSPYLVTPAGCADGHEEFSYRK